MSSRTTPPIMCSMSLPLNVVVPAPFCHPAAQHRDRGAVVTEHWGRDHRFACQFMGYAPLPHVLLTNAQHSASVEDVTTRLIVVES